MRDKLETDNIVEYGKERKRGRKEEDEKGKVLHKRLFEISFFYYVKQKEK